MDDAREPLPANSGHVRFGLPSLPSVFIWNGEGVVCWWVLGESSRCKCNAQYKPTDQRSPAAATEYRWVMLVIYSVIPLCSWFIDLGTPTFACWSCKKSNIRPDIPPVCEKMCSSVLLWMLRYSGRCGKLEGRHGTLEMMMLFGVSGIEFYGSPGRLATHALHR